MQQNQDLSTVEDEGVLHLDSQQKLHEIDQLYKENFYTPSLEINEESHYLSRRQQKVLSPRSEDEIDKLLHGHAIAQVNTDMQCAHGQEGDGGTSSSAEKNDSPVNSFIDQQVEDVHMAESDEIKSVISDLSIEEDSMQGSLVLILECDNVKTSISDTESNFNDQEYSVPNLMEENPTIEIIWNKEDRVMNENIRMSLERSLHKEVIQFVHEQQDENFIQVKGFLWMNLW